LTLHIIQTFKTIISFTKKSNSKVELVHYHLHISIEDQDFSNEYALLCINLVMRPCVFLIYIGCTISFALTLGELASHIRL
jgi:hypothetical protein